MKIHNITIRTTLTATGPHRATQPTPRPLALGISLPYGLRWKLMEAVASRTLICNLYHEAYHLRDMLKWMWTST